jgi:hypothetical protein
MREEKTMRDIAKTAIRSLLGSDRSRPAPTPTALRPDELEEISPGRLAEGRFFDDSGAAEESAHTCVVYSTFCGPAEHCALGERITETDWPHVFLSNNETVLRRAEKAGWRPVALDFRVSDNPLLSAHQAKVAKALPHLFPSLMAAHTTVYHDDKLVLDYAKLAALTGAPESRDAAVRLPLHPFLGGNVLLELTEAMLQPRYFAQRTSMIRFITDRIAEGDRLGGVPLFATGIMIRDMTDPRTRDINEAWYKAILECGIECQIAFAFVAQRFEGIVGFDWDALGVDRPPLPYIEVGAADARSSAG